MAVGDLTTVDAVRDYLGLQTTDADAKLAGFVTASSAWVVSQLGNLPVLAATYTEVRDGNGTSSLVLERHPVNSVTSVTVDGETVPARATYADQGWTLDGVRIRLWGYYFTNGVANVSVVYNAGYVTVPADLEMACRKHAAMSFRQADRQGLNSASVTGESASYDADREWASIMGMLDPYRDLDFA